MPIYEYECPACEKIFEVQQRIADKPLSTCPECNGKIQKLISVSSFQLKGGGWYSDGYGGPSNGNGDSKASSSAKTENTPTPPCKGGESPCKNCPSAT